MRREEKEMRRRRNKGKMLREEKTRIRGKEEEMRKM